MIYKFLTILSLLVCYNIFATDINHEDETVTEVRVPQTIDPIDERTEELLGIQTIIIFNLIIDDKEKINCKLAFDLFKQANNLDENSPSTNCVKETIENTFVSDNTAFQNYLLQASVSDIRETGMQSHCTKVMFELALMYKDGSGIDENLKKAIHLLTLASNLHHKEASYELGTTYHRLYIQDRSTKYLKKSATHIIESAQNGNLDAKQSIAPFFLYSSHFCRKMGSELRNAAIMQFYDFVRHNYASSLIQCRQLSKMKRLKKFPIIALVYYQKEVHKNNPEAQYELGMMYRKGYAVYRDVTTGNSFLQLASDQGYKKATSKLQPWWSRWFR